MGISPYLKGLRDHVGSALIMVPGVIAIILDGDGRVLLQRRGDNGQWGLPGGAVDPGETPAGAIVREVREETGLEVIPERIAAVIGGPDMRLTYPNGDVVEVSATVFACRVTGGRLVADGGETLDLAYFGRSALPPLYPPVTVKVLECLDGGAWFQPA